MRLAVLCLLISSYQQPVPVIGRPVVVRQSNEYLQKNLSRAYKLLDDEQFQEAITLFQTIRDKPQCPVPVRLACNDSLTQGYLKIGKYREALPYLNDSISVRKTSIVLAKKDDNQRKLLTINYIHKAHVLRVLKDYAQCLISLNKALHVSPGDEGALSDRSEVYMTLKRYPEAILDQSTLIQTLRRRLLVHQKASQLYGIRTKEIALLYARSHAYRATGREELARKDGAQADYLTNQL